jgi:NADPH:quinone reductase-like Zn-dependent oxidoreductase
VIGVDEAHDYEREGFSLRRATAARAPFDLAVDCVGTARTERSAIELLKYGVGRYVTLHGDLGKHIASERGMVYGAMRGVGEYARKATITRWQRDVGYEQAVMRLDPDAMIDIARLVESGKLRVPVGEVLALEDIERACDLLRDPAVFGKIVVRVSEG